jgi:tyrosinase
VAVRQFDGVDDVIRCGVGGAALTGAFTVAVLMKKTRDGHMETFLCSHTSGGAATVLLGSDDTDYVYYEVNGAWGRGATKVRVTNGWLLIVITKAAGSSTVRVHSRPLTGTTWSHGAGSAGAQANPAATTGGQWRFANRGTNVFEAPRLAVAGVWNVAMTDAQVEALATNKRTTDWASHAAGAPRALWELNQTSVATPVADLTGNGAGQVSIVGTTVVTGDDPPAWVFGIAAPPPPATGVRKNIYNLTTTEFNNWITALQGIKANGVYDNFTRRHQNAMMQLTLAAGETGTQRNVAHNGPSFGPWHRQCLRELELEMQKIVPGVMLPYWRWEADRTTWTTARIWTMIGGNGSYSAGRRVVDGPFSGWNSVIWNDQTMAFEGRAGIIRQFWTDPLPDVSPAQTITSYDVSPWSESSSTSRSFRNFIEDAHNSVHVHIGGDMQAGTAPNDPVFWLHHVNIDRLWAQWQTTRGITNYQPVSGAPAGQNLNDRMLFLTSTTTTPASVLDWTQLGYSYDTNV